jgi:D-beta-D-heptose 7-phosphate kinase / D-beta-D-heptose 1-phosphate adenosyltransferase
MSVDPSALLERFAGLRVLVLGDAMLDSYLEGSADRICREAPVPTVALRRRIDAPGGAANTAANVARLGAHASMFGLVGDDSEADLLRRVLAERGVHDDALLSEAGRVTLAKHRIVADGQMLLRYDHGTAMPPSAESEAALCGLLRDRWPGCDAVIVSDYAYGVLTPGLLRTLARLQHERPRPLLVDARDLTRYRESGVTVVKPNWLETAALLGLPALGRSRADAVAAQQRRLLELTGAQIAAVTLDVDGAIILERGREPYRTYARRAQYSARAAGGGDTFAAAFALALAAGGYTPAAAELASAAATVAVAKDGTGDCDALELAEALDSEEKIVRDAGRLAARLDGQRRQGRRIVFTNGCFDILHAGHVAYLNRAKALGDLLVVGLNTDESVRGLKGAERPINPLDDRAHVLAALSCVDYIVPFAAPTPVEIIRAVRPEVFVKGGDYTRAMLPEAREVEAYGGEVTLLRYVEDRSTTGIIARIRQASGQT